MYNCHIPAQALIRLGNTIIVKTKKINKNKHKLPIGPIQPSSIMIGQWKPIKKSTKFSKLKYIKSQIKVKLKLEVKVETGGQS